uniref:Acyl-protein synthetase, LuxE n=1 Tax=Rhodopseudomonas palustris (strain BisA53) TaxID=316055 RepID=Q07JQ2_RHOP5
MTKHDSTQALDALMALPDAFAHNADSDACFLAAMQEAFAFHYQASPVYRALCDDAGFAPKDLKTADDLAKLPYILVDVFKRHHLTSLPEEQITITFTSSGTSGQKSHIALDQASFDRQALMRRRIIESQGLASDIPVNYLVFSYDPSLAEGVGAAHTHAIYATFAPALEKIFAIRADADGKPSFDDRDCVDVLCRYAEQSAPVRIGGFPAFSWRTLQELERQGKRLRFAPGSLVIHGGGWKSMADEAIPPELYASKVEELLGIPRQNVRDFYGFVEHGVPYVTCAEGHFHVPVYGRVFIRDPLTLKLLPEGAVGLPQMLTAYNRAQPNISVLATDYAALHSNCPCGRKGWTLSLHGRAGVRKHQGCALTASELLRARAA